MAAEANTQAQSNRTPEVAFGLDQNLGAALSYIAIFGLVMLFVEDDNEFVRFHAAQAVVIAVVLVGVNVVLTIATSILATLPVIGAIASLIPMIVSLAGLVVWLLLVYKAYSGELFRVPVLAGFADQLEAAI